MKTFQLVGLVFSILVGSFTLKAYGETHWCRDGVAKQGSEAQKSEAHIRDKSWTAGWVEKSCDSQVEPESDLTNRSSFLAEGTGFEPATDFSASDFESCKILSLTFSQSSVGRFSREILNRIDSCSIDVIYV